MKKFLIINPFGIGDVLFTTPLIRAIKDNFPDSVVSYWCNERARDILKNNPRLDKIFALSRGDLKKIFQESTLKGARRFLNLFCRIKKEKFDATFDFSLDHRYGLIAKLAGIKKRVGFNYKKRGRFLTDKIDIDGYGNRHMVERCLDLLRFFGIKTGGAYNLEIFISENDKIHSSIILGRAGIKDKGRLVAISPAAGASWGKNASLKHWSAIKYAQLADKIIDNFGATILILGDIFEKPIADIIVAAMKHRAIDLTGKTSLAELAAVINDLRLLVTNDGGPLHIAVALGIKTVSIFGPADDKVYGPYPAGPGHIVLKQDLSCRPCYQKFRMPECEYDRKCLSLIGVEEVFDAVRRQL